jgi:hypothetical protein
MTLRLSGVLLLALTALLPGRAAPDDEYQLGPDSLPQPGVPKGKVTKHSWTSQVFPGTVRDWWLYVPAQYDGSTPACVMVFQDGGNYVNVTDRGQFRVPVVFDNLIHKKQLPLMVGVFVNPGEVPAASGQRGRSNRSFEYDTLSDQYARFLEAEILPEVGKTVKLRQDAAGRGIGGISSGGICAFTAAWERPDLFSKVLSHVGSFTNIRGGDAYPGLIRKTEGKPIRVFLQDGENDLDNQFGNWPPRPGGPAGQGGGRGGPGAAGGRVPAGVGLGRVPDAARRPRRGPRPGRRPAAAPLGAAADRGRGLVRLRPPRVGAAGGRANLVQRWRAP